MPMTFAPGTEVPIPSMQRTRDYAHAALSRLADESEPAGVAGERRARAAPALSRGRGRRGDARPELTRLSPDRESGGQASRGGRPADRHHGLRQGHRGALRRATVP